MQSIQLEITLPLDKVKFGAKVESVIIQNKLLKVEIFLLGAEVRSVKNLQNNNEYMWDGNPSIWAGVSPVLFPVVGRTTNGYISFKQKKYPLNNHGFARQSLFNVAKHSLDSVTLNINTYSLEKDTFPFNLDFSVTYTLKDNTLITTFRVINSDTQIAYFSVGAHPAFKCPFDDKHQLDDYEIEFAANQQLTLHTLNNGGLFSDSTPVNIDKIDISKNTFDNDALIYSNFEQSWAQLSEKKTGKYIKVNFDNFPWFGIWSKPGARYICLEPWCGHADNAGFNQEIQYKSGIIELNPSNSWEQYYSIEFGY